jgi:hypothetical protein
MGQYVPQLEHRMVGIGLLTTESGGVGGEVVIVTCRCIGFGF